MLCTAKRDEVEPEADEDRLASVPPVLLLPPAVAAVVFSLFVAGAGLGAGVGPPPLPPFLSASRSCKKVAYNSAAVLPATDELAFGQKSTLNTIGRSVIVVSLNAVCVVPLLLLVLLPMGTRTVAEVGAAGSASRLTMKKRRSTLGIFERLGSFCSAFLSSERAGPAPSAIGAQCDKRKVPRTTESVQARRRHTKRKRERKHKRGKCQLEEDRQRKHTR